MKHLEKVEGYKSLRKDAQTNAIVNVDRIGLLQAKEARKRVIDSKQKVIDLEERIKQLEDIITKIVTTKE